MQNKIFTIVIAHYNQFDLLKKAIDSVLYQNYKKIQLIIADDCSLSKEQVSEINNFVNTNKNKNIVDYKFLSNVENLGTVKNINNALNHAKGEYVLFFAADDLLYDENVIENFSNEFDNSTYNVITAQCYMFDSEMEKNSGPYVNVKNAIQNNKMTSLEQFKKLAFSCIYGSGGTAYRKEVFTKFGKFNEKYKLVEDWAYYLYITRNGEKIIFKDFPALKHRDGGVSHSNYNKETIPSHVKQYYIDILNIYEKEILTYLNYFDFNTKLKLINRYKQHLDYYYTFIPNVVSPRMHNIYKIYLKDKELFWNKFKILLFKIFKKIYRLIVKYTFISIILYLIGILTKIITFKEFLIIIVVLLMLDISTLLNRKFVNR